MEATIPASKIRVKGFEKKNIEVNRNPNLREQQKILFEDTSSDYNSNFIDFPNIDFPIFDLKKIRDFREKQINNLANSIKGTDLSFASKRLKILDEMNTSSESGDIEYDSDSDTEEASTYYSSYSLVDQSDEKVKYWIKYKLYDNITDCNYQGKIKLPKLIQLDREIYCYYYLNTLKTYYYTKSAILGSNKSINDFKYDLDECKFNESLGLFFCGQNIKYNNENTICSPNNMICKKCMEKNIKRYNLENNCLININGRVATKAGKKNKRFHCFGHFLIGKNQLENCLDKFCCDACSLLNKYKKYYFS
jgi:hypothetical protein